MSPYRPEVGNDDEEIVEQEVSTAAPCWIAYFGQLQLNCAAANIGEQSGCQEEGEGMELVYEEFKLEVSDRYRVFLRNDRENRTYGRNDVFSLCMSSYWHIIRLVDVRRRAAKVPRWGKDPEQSIALRGLPRGFVCLRPENQIK